MAGQWLQVVSQPVFLPMSGTKSSYHSQLLNSGPHDWKVNILWPKLMSPLLFLLTIIIIIISRISLCSTGWPEMCDELVSNSDPPASAQQMQELKVCAYHTLLFVLFLSPLYYILSVWKMSPATPPSFPLFPLVNPPHHNFWHHWDTVDK